MSNTKLTIMDDIPRSSGNTFIIYADIKGKPTVAQNIILSATTGIKSVVGELDNSALKITWNGSDWDITCKKAAGDNASPHANFYNFKCSVSSKGSKTRKAATVDFSFEVILCNIDDNFQMFYRQYQVGDKVREKLEQLTANPKHSYGVWGQLYSPDANRYGSGLYLALIDEIGDDFEEPFLMGTASRPGLYVAAIHCTTDDKSGLHGNNDMAAMVIVSIRDKNYADNQIMVMADNGIINDENTVKLVYCKDALFANKGGCFSVKMINKNGEWTGKYEEKAQTTIWVTEYRIALTGKTWHLSRREYTKGDNPPSWSAVSTVAALEYSTLPPSYGWSNGAVVSGHTMYHVPEYGLFDYKGVNDGVPFYQQQTTHTRQYKGWKTAAEYTNNKGYILTLQEVNEEKQWVLLEHNSNTMVEEDVSALPVAGVVVPYSPPTTEKYGSKSVRDIAFENICINTPPNNLAMISGNIAGGFWKWPNEARELVPYNGTSGDKEYYMAGVSATVEKYSFYEQGEKGEHSYIEGDGMYKKWSRSVKRKQGIKLKWDIDRSHLKYSQREKDVFQWLMAVATPTISTEHIWEGEYSANSIEGWYDYSNIENGYEILGRFTTSGRYNKGEDIFSESKNPTRFTFYIGSGADYKSGKWHNIWSVPRWQGGTVSLSASDKEIVEDISDYGDGDIFTEEVTHEYPLSINFSPNHFLRIPALVKVGEDFSIEKQKLIDDQSTFTAKIEKYQEHYDYDVWLYDIASVDIRLYYDLTISFNRVYTSVADSEIWDSYNVVMTKVEIKDGSYADWPDSISTTTTYSTTGNQGSITTVTRTPDGQEKEVVENLEIAEVIARAQAETDDAIKKAKEDVESCELEKTNTYGDVADGSWTMEGSREELSIQTQK